MSAKVPDRIAWAVDLLEVQVDDQILEFGCGSGVAANLVTRQLVGGTGSPIAIDRSAVAIRRTRDRNGEGIATGRMVVRHRSLADLDIPPDRFDKAFGVNINVFWTSSADAELAVLARVLRQDGKVYLVYEGVPGSRSRDVGPAVASNLERCGFAAEVYRHDAGRMLCITGVPRRIPQQQRRFKVG